MIHHEAKLQLVWLRSATLRSWNSDFKIEENEMSRMYGTIRADERGKDKQIKNISRIQLRRKRRMHRSIQESTVRSRSEVLMPRTSKSDGM